MKRVWMSRALVVVSVALSLVSMEIVRAASKIPPLSGGSASSLSVGIFSGLSMALAFMGRRVRAPKTSANLAIWGLAALLGQQLAQWAAGGWWLIAGKWILALALVGSALALFQLSEVTRQSVRPPLASQPQRPLILYLRSFETDRYFSIHHPIYQIIMRSQPAAMAHCLRHVGDFRPLGDPTSPDSSGERMWGSGKDWQSDVQHALSRAALVLLQAGTTSGLLEEARWVFGGSVRRDRIVLLAPYTKWRRKQVWATFRQHVLATTGVELPEISWWIWGFEFPDGDRAVPLPSGRFWGGPPSPWFWARVLAPSLNRLGLRQPRWSELLSWRTYTTGAASCVFAAMTIWAFLTVRERDRRFHEEVGQTVDQLHTPIAAILKHEQALRAEVFDDLLAAAKRGGQSAVEATSATWKQRLSQQQLPQYMARAPDASLLELAATKLGIIEALALRQDGSCLRLLEGTQAEQGSAAEADARQRLDAALERVVIGAIEHPVLATMAVSADALRAATSQLSDVYGASTTTRLFLRVADAAGRIEMCSAYTELLRAMLAVSTPSDARILRQWLTLEFKAPTPQ